MRHFFLCLSAPATLCRVFLLPPYYPSQQERADPALFAANVHAYMVSFSKSLPGMRTHGGLVPSGGSLKDKRDFHQALLKEREREGEEAKKVA